MQPQSMSHEDRRFFGALEVWKKIPQSGISRADAVRCAVETADALLQQLEETRKPRLEGIREVVGSTNIMDLSPEEAQAMMERTEPTSLGGGFQDTRAQAEQIRAGQGWTAHQLAYIFDLLKKVPARFRPESQGLTQEQELAVSLDNVWAHLDAIERAKKENQPEPEWFGVQQAIDRLTRWGTQGWEAAAALRAELTQERLKGITDHATTLLRLAGLAQEFMDEVNIPERNCSCHISPPCSDCVDNSGLRETGETLQAAIKQVRAEVAR